MGGPRRRCRRARLRTGDPVPPNTMPLKFDAMLPAQPLRQTAELGRGAAAAGLSGLVVTEAGRTAYLTCGAIGRPPTSTSSRVSPWPSRAVPWSRRPRRGNWPRRAGRFRLGLGSQVRAHMVRRYGAAFDHPGPRLREYVLAVKQIFASFRTGAPLDVTGNFYNLSLLPAIWSPVRSTALTHRSTWRPSAPACCAWRPRWRTVSTSTR